MIAVAKEPDDERLGTHADRRHARQRWHGHHRPVGGPPAAVHDLHWVELTDGPPQIVLAGHLDGDRPILVYRVADLEAATAELRAGGSDLGHALEIPQGPVRSFTAPGGQRLALYQLTRPGVVHSFAGRRDF